MHTILPALLLACLLQAPANDPHQFPATQNTTTPRPEFEVATIKPHPLGDRTISLGGDAGRYAAKNVTLKLLVEQAYDVPSDQVSGGPDWTGTQSFDIEAKILDDTWEKIGKLGYHLQQQAIRPMLQSLLADRFRLVLRKEPRELRVYALVVAKGGPRLRPAGSPRLAERFTRGAFYAMALDQDNIPVAELADFLQGRFKRTVLDQTGLEGNYRIAFAVPIPPENSDIDVDSAVFQALDDQLGLKLESRKAIVDTIVVEHADQPSDN